MVTREILTHVSNVLALNSFSSSPQVSFHLQSLNRNIMFMKHKFCSLANENLDTTGVLIIIAEVTYLDVISIVLLASVYLLIANENC